MSFQFVNSVIKSYLCLIIIATHSHCYDYSEWWPQKTTEPPKSLECGVGITSINGEVNGIREAKPGEIPWQVSVQKRNSNSGKWEHVCGGVVINKDFVLTSAKCVDNSSEAFFRSEAGNVNLTKGGWVRRKRQSYPGQQLPGLQYTQRLTIHPQYNRETLENNLALIYLAQPFDVNKAEGKINSICLPEKEIDSESQLSVSGWGAIDGLYNLKPVLQIIKSETVECESLDSNINQLCVIEGLENPSQDCVGDFGGPLFASYGNTSTLLGIYSSGNGCTPEKIANFVDIKPYVEWIKDNSKPIY